MKQRILILGSTGMAGHVIYHYLNNSNKYLVFDCAFRTKLTPTTFICDIRNSNELKGIIETVMPNVIINCVGALIGESKNNPENAIYLNSFFPHYLKKISDGINSKLIHISTDCVFSGKKGFYAEDDFRDADDLYGRSKALGEIINEKDITVRTSIVGPELKTNGEGLMTWFFKQSGQIKGYTNAMWSGVTTLELAKAMEKVIDYNISGIVHLTNGIAISKFELLELFKTIYKIDNLEIIPDSNVKVDKTLRESSKYDFQVPTYREMIMDLKSFSETLQHLPLIHSA